MPTPSERTGVSEAVSAQIRAERAAARLTVEEASERSGIAYSTYRKLDDGRGVANSEQLTRLCRRAFDIPLSEFFRRVEARIANPGDASGTARPHETG